MNKQTLFLLISASFLASQASCQQCEDPAASQSSSSLPNYADIGDAKIPDDVALATRLPRVYLDDDVPESQARIYYGERAHDEQFPYHCSLECYGPGAAGDSPTTYCGCSILSAKFLLTAAHCLTGKWYCMVGYGSNYVKDMKVVRAMHFYVHPLYNETLILNDIALIGLTCNNTLQFSKKVQPIALPQGCDIFRDLTALVPGFGETQKHHYMISSYIRYIEVKVQPYEVCFEHWDVLMPPVKKCVWGAENRTQTTCRGDSGGPLVVHVKGKPVQVGITSFGHADCRSKPAVFTRISTYLDFIRRTMTEADLSMTNV